MITVRGSADAITRPGCSRISMYCGSIQNDNSSFSQQILNTPTAQIEPIVEPDGVLNDRRRESVPLVKACLAFHPATVAKSRLVWQYLRDALVHLPAEALIANSGSTFGAGQQTGFSQMRSQYLPSLRHPLRHDLTCRCAGGSPHRVLTITQGLSENLNRRLLWLCQSLCLCLACWIFGLPC